MMVKRPPVGRTRVEIRFNMNGSIWMMAERPGSEAQKNLATIEKPDQGQAHSDFSAGEHEIAKAMGHVQLQVIMNVASQQTRGHATKAQDVVRHVNGDGVHAIPDKDLAPAT